MEYLPFQLDKERHIGFGMRALSEIERKYDKPIKDIDFDGLFTDEVAFVMCAGLHHEDKELTPEKFMDLVDEYSTMAKMGNVMKAAFDISYEEIAKEEKQKNSLRVAKAKGLV